MKVTGAPFSLKQRCLHFSVATSGPCHCQGRGVLCIGHYRGWEKSFVAPARVPSGMVTYSVGCSHPLGLEVCELLVGP